MKMITIIHENLIFQIVKDMSVLLSIQIIILQTKRKRLMKNH
ncbi:unknown [Prevotella sp. CAG:1058]|nr:unknown [Prevotella sp. CAG:1058]